MRRCHSISNLSEIQFKISLIFRALSMFSKLALLATPIAALYVCLAAKMAEGPADDVVKDVFVVLMQRKYD